jgi:D-arabinose 1-dehydrogenase-like Zn-dependent alcohol dehydrogenase
MRAALIPAPGVPVRIVERDVPVPAPGQALIHVEACGVCHTDVDIAAGRYSWAKFPLTPGHEISGTVAGLGPDTDGPAPGTRVGLTWLNSCCGACAYCLRGDTILCRDTRSTGVDVPGGYQEYVVSAADRLIPLPESLGTREAAPLMCAGLTTFTGLSRLGGLEGQRVAVLGLGGLGRYAVAFAVAMGARVCVVTGSVSKRDDAVHLGAELFIGARGREAAAALRAWEGGPDVVVSTVPDSVSVSELVDCIVPDGRLVVLGIGETPLTLDTHTLVDNRLTVHGSPLGSAKEALAMFVLGDRVVRWPPITYLPLEQAGEALRMTSAGATTGRVVLIP